MKKKKKKNNDAIKIIDINNGAFIIRINPNLLKKRNEDLVPLFLSGKKIHKNKKKIIDRKKKYKNFYD